MGFFATLQGFELNYTSSSGFLENQLCYILCWLILCYTVLTHCTIILHITFDLWQIVQMDLFNFRITLHSLNKKIKKNIQFGLKTLV